MCLLCVFCLVPPTATIPSVKFCIYVVFYALIQFYNRTQESRLRFIISVFFFFSFHLDFEVRWCIVITMSRSFHLIVYILNGGLHVECRVSCHLQIQK